MVRRGSFIGGQDNLSVPDAPTIGATTVDDASVSVAFTAPSDVGDDAITGYGASATDGTNVIGGTGSSSPVTISGLTNGTSYTAQAWAINDYGNGPLSAATGSFTPAIPTPGIDFDDSNDYLVRSSDFTGNSDNKTFTFSVWAYATNNTDAFRLYAGEGNWTYFIHTDKTVDMSASNSSNTQILGVTGTHNSLPIFTWNHILISMDLANASNRYIYFNDVNVTSDFTFSTYTDDNIDFTRTAHSIITNTTGGGGDECRIAGVYLDYTYRDLTTTSNRRLFIDANGLYVAPPTSGILSLTMKDADNAGTNSGTGGDLTLNGTVAQSGRNALQYNAAASTFDGVSTGDKLVRTSQLSNMTDVKTGTFRFSINADGDAGTIISVSSDPMVGTFALVTIAADGTFDLTGVGTDASTKLNATLSGYGIKGKWETHCITFDLSDTSKRAWFVNGVAASPTWATYTDANIDYTRAQSAVANQYGSGSGASPLRAKLSDIWFDTSYIADLSVFYDTTLNKPKSLGGDGSTPTGSSPIVYLPLNGNNAGKNKGTGGDFTVNSGPFTGARGPSEFWGESAQFNGSSQYLQKSGSLSGASDGKEFSFACSFYMDNISSNNDLLMIGTGAGNLRLFFRYNTSNGLECFGFNSSGTTILRFDETGSPLPLAQNAWHNLLISIDITNTSKRYMYVNNTVTTPTWDNYTNDSIEFSTSNNTDIGQDSSNTNFFAGRIGFLWFNTVYTDFSSEANRLKFFDAFGYPVDLGSNGSTPTGSQPLIYINKGFHSGTNLGSAGNFTPQGTPTDGGYVKG